MARGGDDSDEERHDRFRSERNSSTPKPLFPGGLKRSNLNSSLGDDRRRDRRRSRDRSPSRSRRDRSPDVRRREIDDRRSQKRRSYSPDREAQSRKKTKQRSRSPSHDKHKSKHRSRGSSERRSESHSSHDSRTERKRSKHPKGHREEDGERHVPKVDTFADRFNRRRDSSVEEEVVDNSVMYRITPSPERTKHKKKKNGEREKRKEKKKDKKKKKKSNSLDESSLLHDDGIEDVDSPEDKLPRGINSPQTVNDVYGPRMPPSKSSPTVPSSSPEALLPGNRSSLTEPPTKQEEEDVHGPVAPQKDFESSAEGSDKGLGAEAPEAAQKESSRVYGPVLPHREDVAEVNDEDSSYGPALPPRLLNQPKPAPSVEDDSDDDGGYGPLPAGLGGRTQEELEMRAALIKRQLKNQEENESRPKKREDWMLELPDSKRAHLGLGPRKFRAREAPDMSDRSSWTDTPEEKKMKEEMSRLGIDAADDDDNSNSRRLGIIQRDKEMEKKVREGKKKEKSLLDMHQKQLKKKKKKEEKERAGKKEERRPFSREIDLQTNKFDEAQKRSIIKKAQLLDSRFSRGESKFL